MWPYIIKRLLLMLPTLLGIVLITFLVLQMVPGGPVEQMISRLRAPTAPGESGAAGGFAHRILLPPSRPY